MKDFKFIFLRLSFYLILGILAAFHISAKMQHVIVLGLGSIIFFIISFVRSRKLVFPDQFFGIASFLLIFSLGFSSVYLRLPEHQKKHYIHQQSEDHTALLLAGITEELRPTAYQHRFILQTDRLIYNTTQVPLKGKLLLNVPIDSSSIKNLQPGMQLMLPWKPEEIKPALNPFQFDYKGYLKGLGIERQLNVPKSYIHVYNMPASDIRAIAWNLREDLITKLKEHDFGRNEIAVFQALILGQRRDINNVLYQNYAAAGAVHILAISGLHIGLLMFFLNFLLNPLNQLKHGRLIKLILMLGLLWGFAVLTGLSPSVVRAVSMFSIIAFGMQLKRKTSVLNSLFLSLFIMLLINPYYIFQAGFQLSYLAVWSIIFFQPIIYRLVKPKWRLLNYFWKLTSVSIAAQLGVIPLSLYYFHQFPGLFLLSNLIILPALGIVLAFGIFVILLAALELLPALLTNLFNSLLKALNNFVEEIANVDSLVFNNIHLSLLQTLSLYLVLLSVYLLLKKPSYRFLVFTLTAIIVLQLSTIHYNRAIPPSETIIFHKNGGSVITLRKAKKLEIYSDMMAPEDFLKDYIRERKIIQTTRQSIPDLMELSGSHALIIDSIRNYRLEDFSPEIIVLRNSPPVNLERLTEELSPTMIVADGSNFHSYIKRWKKTAAYKKIPFHYTGEKGAFILVK